MESWGFRFEGYKMRCGFISLDQFRFKGRVIEGTQTFDLFLLREVSFSLSDLSMRRDTESTIGQH